MKGNDDVIREFNEYVNMTADELEKWLKSDDSNSAGWPKDGGDGGGESVGHDSGRKIVEILKANPKKDPKKYSDDQIAHMRKVASYCARHLAQEEKSNDSKPAEEVKKTKSYASLKNWGHDPLKKRSGGGGAKGKSSNAKASNGTAKKDEDDDDQQDDNADEDETDGKHAGDKRKAQDSQNGQKKEQKTEPRATRSSTRNKPADNKQEEDSSSKKAAPKEQRQSGRGSKTEKNETASKKSESKKSEFKEENGSKQDTESKGKSDDGGKPTKGPKKGDTVSWNWGSGQPQGKVLDVKGEKTSITTKRGNEVSRDGDPEDPAVVLDTGKSKAIKSAHELN